MILLERYRSLAEGMWTTCYRIEDDGRLWRVVVLVDRSEVYRSWGLPLSDALRLLDEMLRRAPGVPCDPPRS